MSAIASGLSFSASDTGTESASGKTNSAYFSDEFLHESQMIIININKKILPFIQGIMG